MEFQGFSPETIDFLWGIRFNNDRTWFQEHKHLYQTAVYEPMKALGERLAPAFAHVDGLRLHVSRIYRDMRMHPSTFYKDSLWFCFRHDGSSWLMRPCLCFEVRPEGYRYGFLLLAPSASDMEAIRRKISQNPENFCRLVRKAETDGGVPLDGDRYRRPKPCDDARVEKFFAMKNFFAIRDCPPDDLFFSEKLADEVQKLLLAWLPVYEFFHDPMTAEAP